VSALHVEPIRSPDTPDTRVEEIIETRNEAIGNAQREAIVLGLPLDTRSIESGDIVSAIAETAESEAADLLVLGWPRPVPGKRDPSPTVAQLLERCGCDVAVLLDRRDPPWRNVLLPFVGGAHDLLAVDMVRRISASGASITILHIVDPDRPAGEAPKLRTRERGSFRDERVTLKVVESREPVRETLLEATNGYDLIVIGVSPTFHAGDYPWSVRNERLARESGASLLVVHSHRVSAGVSAAGSEAVGVSD
jgi:nucleotide-binding universal stress UspA family protein